MSIYGNNPRNNKGMLIYDKEQWESYYPDEYNDAGIVPYIWTGGQKDTNVVTNTGNGERKDVAVGQVSKQDGDKEKPAEKYKPAIPDWARMLGEIALSAIPGFAETYFPAKEKAWTDRITSHAIQLINEGKDPNQVFATLKDYYGKHIMNANFDKVRDNVFKHYNELVDLDDKTVNNTVRRQEAVTKAWLLGQKITYPGVVTPKVTASEMIVKARELGFDVTVDDNQMYKIMIKEDEDYNRFKQLYDYAKENDVSPKLLSSIFTSDETFHTMAMKHKQEMEILNKEIEKARKSAAKGKKEVTYQEALTYLNNNYPGWSAVKGGYQEQQIVEDFMKIMNATTYEIGKYNSTNNAFIYLLPEIQKRAKEGRTKEEADIQKSDLRIKEQKSKSSYGEIIDLLGKRQEK